MVMIKIMMILIVTVVMMLISHSGKFASSSAKVHGAVTSSFEAEASDL